MKWIIRTLLAIFGGGSVALGIKAIKDRKSQKDFERTMAKAKAALEKNKTELASMAEDEDKKTREMIAQMEKMINDLELNTDIFDAECLDLIKIQD